MAEVKGSFGRNGWIGSPGIGKRKIRVLKVDQKVNFISNEDEAKNRRALYPMIVTTSGFKMEIGFVSYEERGKFNRWISDYMRSVVDGTAQVGTMNIAIPHLDFTRVAVPETEIEYGEGLTDLMYTLRMGFVGASDPANLDLGARMAGLSYFKMPEHNQTSRFFYPSGRQVKGMESLDATTYDMPVSFTTDAASDPARLEDLP